MNAYRYYSDFLNEKTYKTNESKINSNSYRRDDKEFQDAGCFVESLDTNNQNKIYYAKKDIDLYLDDYAGNSILNEFFATRLLKYTQVKDLW